MESGGAYIGWTGRYDQGLKYTNTTFSLSYTLERDRFYIFSFGGQILRVEMLLETYAGKNRQTELHIDLDPLTESDIAALDKKLNGGPAYLKEASAPADAPAPTATPAPVSVSSGEYDGLTYEVTDEGKAVITGYTSWETDLRIPAEIDGKPVAAIGEKAFAQSKVSRLQLPDSLEQIGDQAFFESKLSRVSLPASVKTVGSYAFAGEGSAALGQVERIGSNSFDGRAVDALPDTLAFIDGCAFETSPIQAIALPEGLTHIGLRAFPAQAILYTQSGTYAQQWAQENGYWYENTDAQEEEDTDWLNN